MSKIILLTIGIFSITIVAIILTRTISPLLPNSCSINSAGHETSFWNEDNIQRDIPDNLVNNHYAVTCYSEQVAQQVLAGKATIADLAFAHHKYWLVNAQVSFYLTDNPVRPIRSSKVDLAQWLSLAKTPGNLRIDGNRYYGTSPYSFVEWRCSDQTRSDCSLDKIIEYRDLGPRFDRRVFDHKGLLLIDWEHLA